MKMTDVARTTEFEIAKIERFVDAVFSFVVAVASIAYLIDFRFDAVASVAVRQMNVSVLVLMTLKTEKMILC